MGESGPGRGRFPLRPVALLAVSVEARAVPERAVGCRVAELLVHDGQRVEDARVIGTEHAEADQLQEARVDDRALIDQRSAVGELNLRPGVRVAVSGDPQEVGLAAVRAVAW